MSMKERGRRKEMNIVKAFDTEAMQAFEPEAKVGLLATVTPDGLPHMTLITTLQAKTPQQLIWGQFIEGRSKAFVRTNPKTAFLILTMDRRLWRGRAIWTHAVKEGPDYDMFNTKPMFRYNAYLGIHTVHYMDLVDTCGCEKLPLAAIGISTLLTALTKWPARTHIHDHILKPWAQKLFNGLATLKFIATIGTDGFPAITPILQCQAADSRRLAFAPCAYKEDLAAIPDGAPAAVFALSMQMEDCLVRGAYLKTIPRTRLSGLDIDWVYNAIPPVPGQIYPPLELESINLSGSWDA
jgi:hypothetical protein